MNRSATSRPRIPTRVVLALVPVMALVLTGATASAPAQAEPAPVRMWLTEGTDSGSAVRLAEQPVLTWTDVPEPGTVDATIVIDPTDQMQQMTGFGASFTDSASSNIDRLSTGARDALMTELFDRDEGIGLSFLRQPLGASDYVDPAFPGGNFYTYMPTYNSQINVDRDDRSIALVKQAQQINDAITVMGTPWSPPAWMRNGTTMFGSTANNWLRPSDMDAYAKYLADTTVEYQAKGITLDLISVQNEPLYAPQYPGMLLPATDRAAAAMGMPSSATQVDVVRSLSSKLAEAQLPTQILVYDHNWDIPSENWNDDSWSDPYSTNPAYPVEVLADATGGTQIADLPNVAGTALHCYEGLAGGSNKPGNSTLLHNRFPDAGVYFTECSGTETANTFSDTMSYHASNYIFPTLRNWSQSLVFWNMALDENAGPYPSGYDICGDCSAIVTVPSGQDSAYTKNIGYYLLGHFSKFVSPGAVRIGSNDTSAQGIHNVAFENPDGTFAAVLYSTRSDNAGEEDQVSPPLTAVVETEHGFVTVTMPRNSMATLTWGEPDDDGDGGDNGGGAVPPVRPTPPAPQKPTPPATAPKKITVRTKAKIVRNAKPRKAVKKAKVKTRLRVKAGKHQPKKAKVKYHWLRGGKKIKGAKKVRYRVTKKDRGKKLRVRVTVTAKGHKKLTYRTKVVRVPKR